jgi:hypothetical protein
MVTLAAVEAWLVALPIAHAVNAHLITWGTGNGWTPPLWLGLLGIPCAILWVFLSLHILNGWSWICARWAEVLLRNALPTAAALTQLAPLVSTSPQPPMAPLVSTAPQPPAAPAAPPEAQPAAHDGTPDSSSD